MVNLETCSWSKCQWCAHPQMGHLYNIPHKAQALLQKKRGDYNNQRLARTTEKQYLPYMTGPIYSWTHRSFGYLSKITLTNSPPHRGSGSLAPTLNEELWSGEGFWEIEGKSVFFSDVCLSIHHNHPGIYEDQNWSQEITKTENRLQSWKGVGVRYRSRRW